MAESPIQKARKREKTALEKFGQAMKKAWESAPVFVIRYVTLFSALITAIIYLNKVVLGLIGNQGLRPEAAYLGLLTPAILAAMTLLARAHIWRPNGASFGLTYALVVRAMALVCLAVYSYRRQYMWPVVGAYSLYVVTLLYLVVSPGYHSEKGRELRNLGDMVIACAAALFDRNMFSPAMMLFSIPLTVGSKYLWINRSWMTLLFPLFTFFAILLYKVDTFHGSVAFPEVFRTIDTPLSPRWLLVLMVFFTLLLVIVPAYERFRTWHPMLARLRDVANSVKGARSANTAASLLCKHLEASRCHFFERRSDSWVELTSGTPLSPALQLDDCLRDSRFVSTSTIAARTEDGQLAILVSERRLHRGIATFTEEDSLVLEVVVAMLAQRPSDGERQWTMSQPPSPEIS